MLMKRWLAAHDWLDNEDFLFPSLTRPGERLTTERISNIVKEVAVFSGLQGRFSSHSLRIGGATAAVMAGMTLAEVFAIGGWMSKSLEHYLRAIGSAKSGASKKMGL